MIRKILSGLLSRLVPDATKDAFNVAALPVSPVDGIDIDKLNRIIGDAYHGHADELFTLYSDIVSRDSTFIAGGLQRKAPLIARNTSVTAPAKAAADTIARRDFLRKQWAQCRNKRMAIAHLLDATVWPVTYVRKVFRPAAPGSGHYYDLAELRPVPFWHITFAADATAGAGIPKIKEFDAAGNWTGKTHLPDPVKYIEHRGHLLQALPDCWGGPMRAVVFWWYYASWARGAAANHLESHNQPKFIAKYGRVDAEKGKKELLRAFSRTSNTRALVIPEDAKIEAIATLKGETATAFMEFIKLCQREIAKVIIVQTLTLEAQAQGLGSGQSDVQDGALDGVREFDSVMLAETIEQQVFRPALDINGMPGGTTPSLSWAAEDDDARVKADMLSALRQAGLRVRADGLEKLSGFVGLPMEFLPEAPPRLDQFSAETRRDPVPQPAIDARAATDKLAEAAAADLAEAFGADFAGLSRALREATGPADLLRRVQPLVAGFAPHKSVRVLEETLATATANGLLCAHHTTER